MTATAGKQSRSQAPGEFDYAGQKGNTKIYAGTIVMLDSSARAIEGASGSGNFGVGVAEYNGGLDRYDATSTGPRGQLADNVQKVRWKEGIFLLKNSGTSPLLTTDRPGRIIFVEDNETVRKLGTGYSPAGLLDRVDSDGVWVKMSKEIGALCDLIVRQTTNTITDPGNAGAIPVGVSGVCPMTSAGAETRTLAIPTFVGQRIALIDDTHAGNIVVTSAQAINQAGNTVMTFGAVADMIELTAMTIGGALRWRVTANDGVALS